jgi:ABC-type Na+ efflux pump permease subunit
MRRIGLIAEREFLGTVLTRGFIVGVLVVPAVMALAFALGPRLMNQRSAPVRGQIAVIDPTGAVMAELRATITPAAIAARREEAARRALAAVPAGVRDLAGAAATAPSSDAIERIAGTVPDLQVIDRPADAGDPDMRAAKAWLTDAAPGDRHIALVVVQPDAVTRAPGRIDYGTYELYVPLNLDDRIETSIFESLREAIINARVRAQHLDRVSLDEIARVPRARSVTVTKDSERVTVGAFNRIMPFAFVGLLLVSVLMGGQGLMMSTVEEKTSRVIEVLLSAVSPFELLAGKIVGQMAVSLVVLGLYIVLAFMLLASFAMFGLLDLSLVFYLLIFFVITYVTIGAAMAVADDADHARVDGAVGAGGADRPRAELDIQHRDQLHAAGQYVRDAAAPHVQRAAAVLAGLGDDRNRPRIGRRIRLVRLAGLHDRPADARQAARPEDAGAVDPRGVISTPTATSSPLRAACAGQTAPSPSGDPTTSRV